MDIAPGERKLPISLLRDDFFEELASQYLFIEGKIEYKIYRQVKLN